MVGAGHQSAFQMRAAARPARLREGRRLEPPPGDAVAPRRHRRRGRPAVRGRRPRPPRRRGRRHHHHHLELRPDPEGAPRSAPAPISPAWAPTPRASRRSRPRSSPRATVFTDEVAQSVSIGEAQHAVAAGLIAEAAITQIGAVINGTHPGRRSADEITLFDGTGVGLQDLAVAAAVVELARRPPARPSRSPSDARPGRTAGPRGPALRFNPDRSRIWIIRARTHPSPTP